MPVIHVSKKNIVITMALLLFSVLLVIMWKKNKLSVFNKPLTRVKVESEFNYLDKVDVQKVINPLLKVNFWQADLSLIKQRLSALPWVQSVVIRRVWPDSLMISIVEKHPVARWNQQGLVNYDGSVFYPEHQYEDRNLPELNGPEGREWEILTKYQEMKNLTKLAGLNISSFSMNERGIWQLTFKNGIKAVLGKTELLSKMQRFIHVYNKLLIQKIERIRSVDMRYYSGFAVSWKKMGEAQ